MTSNGFRALGFSMNDARIVLAGRGPLLLVDDAAAGLARLTHSRAPSPAVPVADRPVRDHTG